MQNRVRLLFILLLTGTPLRSNSARDIATLSILETLPIPSASSKTQMPVKNLCSGELEKFAKMVFHEFSNLSTAIAGGAEMVRLGLKENELSLSKEGDQILNQGLAMMKRLGERLLKIAKGESLNLDLLSLNQLEQDWSSALQTAVGPDVEVKFSLEGTRTAKVFANSSALFHSILNLVLNARRFSQPKSSIELKIRYSTLRNLEPQLTIPHQIIEWIERLLLSSSQ